MGESQQMQEDGIHGANYKSDAATKLQALQRGHARKQAMAAKKGVALKLQSLQARLGL
jgi:hypothetical protein